MKRLIAIGLFLLMLCGCSNQTPSVPQTATNDQPTTVTVPTVTEPTVTDPPVTEPPVTEPPATEPTVTEPPVTEPEPPVEVSITLSFTGDCTLGTNQKHGYENSFHQYYDKKGPDYFLDNVRSIFEADDLTVVNLEGSLTNSNDRVEKTWNHKGPPEYVSILTGSSVEVATMGNNHRLDYDVSGCQETEQVLTDAGIGYCYDDRYLIQEVQGIKVGFVSVNEHYDGQTKVMAWLKEGHQYLRDQGCALVIACVHWGGNHTPVLGSDQLTMDEKIIDLGYDLLIGNHPHVLQAMRVYNGKFICYSLGNFCYGGSKNPEDKDSGIFQQTFTFLDGVLQPQINARFIPCFLSGKTSKNDYCPTLATGEEFERIIKKINGYSETFDFAWNLDGTYTQ